MRWAQQWLVSARYRVLRLRHTWWHRWAHDPLCDRLGGGVLTVGKLRLCRSCLAMYTGVAVGAAVVAVAPAIGAAAVAPTVWAGSAGSVASASTPPIYRQLSRPAKDAVRFITGTLGGLLLAFLRARRWSAFVILASAAAGAYRILTLARAKQKAAACDGCPELEVDGICSGFAQQAVSLRAYEHDASELAMKLRASGF